MALRHDLPSALASDVLLAPLQPCRRHGCTQQATRLTVCSAAPRRCEALKLHVEVQVRAVRGLAPPNVAQATPTDSNSRSPQFPGLLLCSTPRHNIRVRPNVTGGRESRAPLAPAEPPPPPPVQPGAVADSWLWKHGAKLVVFSFLAVAAVKFWHGDFFGAGCSVLLACCYVSMMSLEL